MDLGNDRKACFQGKVVFWGSTPLGPPKCNLIFETGFRRECGGKLHPFLVGVKVIRPIPGRCPDEIWQYSPTLVSLVPPPSKQKFIVFISNALSPSPSPLLPLYGGTLVDYYIKLWKKDHNHSRYILNTNATGKKKHNNSLQFSNYIT